MDSTTKRLLSDPPLPLLVQMATPNSVAFLIQSGVSLMEVWFIGRLGIAPLAAIALVFPFLILSQAMSGGALGGAVASSIARALGAGNKQKAETLVWHAMIVAVSGAGLFLLVFLFFGAQFLSFLGGSGEVLEAALDYSRVLFFGGLAIWLLGITSAVFRSMGDMKFPAAMMIISAVIQVPLSGCLVLGLFGFPQLGVLGAAWSAVIASSVISSVMLLNLCFGNPIVKLHLKTLVISRDHFRDILSVGLPASVSPLLTVATIVSLTAIVGRFGEQALAGYGIGSRIEFLLIPLVFGIGASMTSLVGLSVGAGDIQRAERIGRTGGYAAALLAGLIGLGLALSPGSWIPAFSDDPEVFASAKTYIQIVGPCFAFQGLGLSLYFASQGAGAMRWPVIALCLRVLIAVGGALLLLNLTSLGLTGIYIAAGLGMIVYGGILFSALQLGAWRRA